ncbi:MAG: hypothetical protein ACJ786_03830 [Catenulispora sp.]
MPSTDASATARLSLAPAGTGAQDQQLTAGLSTAGMLLGGVGFLYGAATATERFGLAPWAWLAAYLTVAAGFAIAVHLLHRAMNATATPTRARRFASAVLDRLNACGPETVLVLALAIPWVAFASYGLIHLAQG